jgi:tRNA(Ile)-lysidine synthase
MPHATVAKFLSANLQADHRRLVVACSGGMDSVCLLDLLVALQPLHGRSLHVMHVHHGLNPHADEWAEGVARLAEHYRLSHHLLRVRIESGGSLEEAARAARYQAIGRSLQPGDVLLTGHHRQDQAETVLLQLFRGSGAAGLAAMRPVSRIPFGPPEIPLWRPLLEIPRAALLAYAERQGLNWVEDDSNEDVRHTRNFLRRQVMPLLEQRWPQAGRLLAGTAERMQEADRLMTDLAELDWSSAANADNTLSIPMMLTLSPPRQANLLRFWIRRAGFDVPDREGLRNLINEVCQARPDGAPLFVWRQLEVRRYRERLYLLTASETTVSDRQPLPWLERLQPLRLADGRILTPCVGSRAGVSLEVWSGVSQLQIRFRQGGERISLPGRGRKELKTLFQEAGIPPWERERRPLIYGDDKLIMVPGLWVDVAAAGKAGEEMVWIT